MERAVDVQKNRIRRGKLSKTQRRLVELYAEYDSSPIWMWSQNNWIMVRIRPQYNLNDFSFTHLTLENLFGELCEFDEDAIFVKVQQPQIPFRLTGA